MLRVDRRNKSLWPNKIRVDAGIVELEIEELLWEL